MTQLTEETAELIVERAKMRAGINEELIEFTGKPAEFIWTDKILTAKNGRKWHEFKIIDTKLIAFASLNEKGFVDVVAEYGDINNP